MSLPALLATAAVMATQPVAESAAPVRCPPAPYHVTDREDRVALTRLAAPPAARAQAFEKRTRPCYLVRDSKGRMKARPIRV